MAEMTSGFDGGGRVTTTAADTAFPAGTLLVGLLAGLLTAEDTFATTGLALVILATAGLPI